MLLYRSAACFTATIVLSMLILTQITETQALDCLKTSKVENDGNSTTMVETKTTCEAGEMCIFSKVKGRRGCQKSAIKTCSTDRCICNWDSCNKACDCTMEKYQNSGSTLRSLFILVMLVPIFQYILS